MEKQKKGRHLETHQKDIFFKNQMVSKKEEENTELERKTSVKHNSKFKTIHFRTLTFLFVGGKGSQQKVSKKPSGHFNTKGFWFEKVE